MTVGRFWIRRPRPPTRSGRGRAVWPGSPSRSRRTTRRLRTILQRGPGFAQEVSALLTQVKPTLPVLLANLTTLGQILVTYNPSLEQLLVLLPGVIAAQQSFGLPKNNPTGLPPERLRVHHRVIRHACTVGFLPPSQWRNPADTTTHRHTGRAVLQTAAGFADRGARRTQLSVHGAPWKARAHGRTLRRPKGLSCRWPFANTRSGRNPFDPNLVAQGVPLDDRVDFNDRIYAPIEGTPLPPGAVPAGTPPDRTGNPLTAPLPPAPSAPPPPPGNSLNGVPIPPVEAPLAPAAGEVPPAPQGPPPGPVEVPPTETARYPRRQVRSTATVLAVRQLRSRRYDPHTGRYMTPRRSAAAADESGCRSATQVVEGPAADLIGRPGGG